VPSRIADSVAVLASVLALGCIPSLGALENPIRIEPGLVAGTVGDISVFKGISYAAPPIAELRWKPPQPTTSWTGVREAKEFGPAMCVSRSGGIRGTRQRGLLNVERVDASQAPR
jgi:hypothetical protein